MPHSGLSNQDSGFAPVHVVWFKRDLRLRDHQPLASAARRGPVLPLYVVEPALVRRPDHAPRHWTFVRESLRELRAALAALGQPLIVRTGEVVAVLAALAEVAPLAALWAHEETGPAAAAARNRAVREWAAARGLPFTELPQDGVRRGGAARGGWSAGWAARVGGSALPPPAVLLPLAGLSPGAIPTHQQLGLPPDDRTVVPPAGEAAGLALLDTFLATRAARYDPAALADPLVIPDTTTRLGPHLAWGTVAVRRVLAGVQGARLKVEGSGEGPLFAGQPPPAPPVWGEPPQAAWAGEYSFEVGDGEGRPDTQPPAEHGAQQKPPASPNSRRLPPDLGGGGGPLPGLRARDRALQRLEDEPHLETASPLPAFDALRATDLVALRNGPDRAARLAAWRAGQTGYPLADAAMRALRATGWLPYCLRALLVTVAAHGLWLPWQALHPHLARLWLDYEPAIHLTQLHDLSGVDGSTPRAESPTALAAALDPSGTFIRRWLPELRRLPDESLARPWLLPADERERLGAAAYPAPIVDHDAVALVALAALAELRRRPDVRAEAAALLAARRTGGKRGPARGQLSLFED